VVAAVGGAVVAAIEACMEFIQSVANEQHGVLLKSIIT
jgi:hypothetical protein